MGMHGIAKWGMAPTDHAAHIAKYGDQKDKNSPMTKYLRQRAASKHRGIEWRFTFLSWWGLWQESGKWELCGRDPGWSVRRKGDKGEHSPDNSYMRMSRHEGLTKPQKKSLREKFEERFYVTPGCWIWTHGTDSHGYGKITYKSVTAKAHRVSYSLYISDIPAGLHILHKCDNPICVNPDHLFMGTHADNMRDKTKKGRAIGAHAGESHHKAKLTVEKVLRIREDARNTTQIAREYNVDRKTIDAVLSRKSWATV